MKEKDLYKQYIKNNIPLLLLGESGTGKSEIIKAIADELSLPLIDLRLSQLPPEDLNGLPAPDGNNSFKYLLPQWYANYLPDKPFILFLDEINQANPATLNALYAIVHDRLVAGVYNKNMHIVAAGNLLSESDYIAELPKPLLNRFVVKQHKPKESTVIEYLKDKYADNADAQKILNTLSTTTWIRNMNPRALERVIKQLCVYKIMDKDEILAQTNSQSLCEMIWDSVKKKKAVELTEESKVEKDLHETVATLLEEKGETVVDMAVNTL